MRKPASEWVDEIRDIEILAAFFESCCAPIGFLCADIVAENSTIPGSSRRGDLVSAASRNELNAMS